MNKLAVLLGLGMIASFLLMGIALASSSPALAYDDCEHERKIDQLVELGDVRQLDIETGAGSLEIIGEKGRKDVQVGGVACSSDKELLEQLAVSVKVKPSSAHFVTEIPDNSGWSGHKQARINLILTVPADSVLQVVDSSGSAKIENIKQLSMVDSSGSLSISDVAGDLKVKDSSGSIKIKNVGGEVELTDSSGSITVEGVGKSVVVMADSSGSINIEDVGEDILVKKDSSGSINVANVGGDFIVGQDSSGGIQHRNVAGKVELPN